ncbi:MAG TPA: oligosaccharide flippase family protein [Rubricoccaceae bacterium]|jgi:PST family polysaccharide transporter
MVIVIGLARSKGVALLIGPAGLGVMGLLTTVMSTASIVLGLGLSSSSVRLIASSQGTAESFGATRRALWQSSLVMGTLGLAFMAGAARPISEIVFGSAAHAVDVAWLGVGVLAGIIGSSQTALLQGLRRTGDLARSGVAGALVGTVSGMAALAVFGVEGIRWFVLAVPVGSMLGALWFTRSIRRADQSAPPNSAVWGQWKAMLPIGGVLVTAGIAGGIADVVVRAVIARHIGIEAAGYFQAASAISIQYLGLILGAMAADYYPRLAAAGQGAAFQAAVDEQLEVAVLLASPILLSVLGLAPWVLATLYSADFRTGADLLRWLVVGDVLKLATWTIGFALLARGQSVTYLAIELSGLAVFTGGTWLLVPRVGLVGAALAFCAYLVWSIIAGWWAARSRHGIAVAQTPARHLALLLGAAILTAAASYQSDLASAGTGLVLAAGAAAFAIRRFQQMDALPDVARRLDRVYKVAARLRRR